MLLQQIKDAVTEERTCVVSGTEVRYSVCSFWPDGVDGAVYYHEGTIYLPARLLKTDRTRAELTAFHEHIEIGHKLAGRSHAYAHRRALLDELLAAKQVFTRPSQFRRYIRDRVKGYPDWKVQDKDGLEARLFELLTAAVPVKGNLLQTITESRL